MTRENDPRGKCPTSIVDHHTLQSHATIELLVTLELTADEKSDRDGRIVAKVKGETELSALESRVKRLLAEN